MSKVKIVTAVFKHPFVKAATTTMDNGKLALKLADDDPPGDQMVDTLEVESTAKIWKCCVCFTGCCWMPLNVLLLLSFGFLAFLNPDPENLWTSASEPGVVHTEDPGNDAFTNYGQLFRAWFMVGFFMTAIWTALCIVFIVGVCCKSSCAMCTSLFGLLVQVVNIAWCIWGFIAFFNEAAATAVGESSTGSESTMTFSTEPANSSSMEFSGLAYLFMYVDFVVIIVLYVIFPIIWCIAGCCGGKDDD